MFMYKLFWKRDRYSDGGEGYNAWFSTFNMEAIYVTTSSIFTK